MFSPAALSCTSSPSSASLCLYSGDSKRRNEGNSSSDSLSESFLAAGVLACFVKQALALSGLTPEPTASRASATQSLTFSSPLLLSNGDSVDDSPESIVWEVLGGLGCLTEGLKGGLRTLRLEFGFVGNNGEGGHLHSTVDVGRSHQIWRLATG